MDNDFLALIEEYKNDRNTIEKIRIYVLNHIYSTPNINEYIIHCHKIHIHISK